MDSKNVKIVNQVQNKTIISFPVSISKEDRKGYIKVKIMIKEKKYKFKLMIV